MYPSWTTASSTICASTGAVAWSWGMFDVLPATLVAIPSSPPTDFSMLATERRSITSSVATMSAAASPMTSATTQDQVAQTVAGVANYGGSLDVILDDAR